MDYDFEDYEKNKYRTNRTMSEEELDDVIRLAGKILKEEQASTNVGSNNNGLNYNAVNSNKKPLLRKKWWTITFLISCVLLVLSVSYIIFYIVSHRKNNISIEDMRKDVSHDYIYEEDNLESDVGNTSKEEKVVIPVDFEALKKINPDIYAWIYIPDTTIDYPIAQNDDSTFYLSHDLNGEKSVDGAIYTEKVNSQEFDDFNTVLYGHNMKNGSMFGTIHDYGRKEYMDAHPYIYIYTQGSIIIYKVFAAYVYDDRHLLNTYDFDDEQVRKAYIEYIFNIKNLYATVKNDEKVDVDSHILTLSTCSGSSDERWLVQAVEVEKKEP